MPGNEKADAHPAWLTHGEENSHANPKKMDYRG